MKNIIMLIIVLFLASTINSQTVREKKLYENLKNESYSIYDFSYDEQSGAFIYAPYDTLKQKTKIISNKGNSAFYDYISLYDAKYDNSGNYYLTGYNTLDLNNGKYEYYLLKNGKEIFKTKIISSPITKQDNGLYFIANKDDKDVRIKYNFLNNELEYGNKYDTIFLTSVKQNIRERDMSFEIGFTKTGKEFYIASKDNKQFMVVGGVEMKPYDEILSGNTIEDNLGNICYIARESVDGKNYYCLVQGEKEFKKFAYVTGPIVTDKDNIPYYSASNNFTDEFPTDQMVVKGNEIISKNFSKGIYDLSFTPSGKLVYTGIDSLMNGISQSTLFIDGNAYITSQSIWGMIFKSDDTPIYFSSESDTVTYLFDGTKKISDAYSYISDLKISKNGIISYMGTINGDYEKNIPSLTYYIFGNKKLGPFENIAMNEETPDLTSVNENGDYAYTATESKKGKDGELNTKYYIIGKDWKSSKYDYISDLMNYKNDFYFVGNIYNSNGNSKNVLCKNGKVIVNDYDTFTGIKLNPEKGTISFLGQKGKSVNIVEVVL